MGLYEKPIIKTYSADDILETMGPGQSQYGSSGGSTQETTLYTTTGNSAVNIDGDVDSDGFVDIGGQIQVGDLTLNESYRGFVGFDISSLSGRTIVSATLRVYQFTASGFPFTDLGTITVDHVNFGTSLGAGDYSADALTPEIGTISSDETVEWKTLDVKSYVQSDLDAVPTRTSSQYRLRFTTNTDNDNEADYIRFYDTEAGSYVPELVITYQ